jgi:membrane associated rhomboid family serine protease
MIPLRDSQPSHSAPVATVLLIVANAAAFFYELGLDPYTRNHLIAVYGLAPERMWYPSLVTSMFLHGGWLHLIGNMWFLWIFGDNVEDILGRFKYLALYLGSGVAAGLTHALVNAGSHVPTIGASGAVAGVMGAYMVKFPRSRILTLVPLFVFITTIELPASFILAYWLVIQFFSGVGSVAHSQLTQGGVAWFAHVGGFLAGILLVNLLRPKEPYRHRRDLHW